MITGIGIDSVDISRFGHWYTYANKLKKIFTPDEILYCLALPHKSAERFAVRFAAKEAFYKAFSATYPEHTIPFLTLCSALHINKDQKAPTLVVAWHKINTHPCKVHISLTHTATQATAVVILEQ